MGEREYLIVELKKFGKELTKKIDVDRILFFGSMARGDNKKESDIDLIIVSRDFEKMDYFERTKLVYRCWKLDLPVDFICYSKSEFNELKKRISIVSQAIKEGIEI